MQQRKDSEASLVEKVQGRLLVSWPMIVTKGLKTDHDHFKSPFKALLSYSRRSET